MCVDCKREPLQCVDVDFPQLTVATLDGGGFAFFYEPGCVAKCDEVLVDSLFFRLQELFVAIPVCLQVQASYH